MVERDHWSFQSRQHVLLCCFVPAIVLAIFSRPVELEGTWLDIELEGVAWILFIGGAAMRFWATLYMGGRKRKALVTAGPYSLCRNPLYLGTMAIALSAALFVQSAAVLAATALSLVLYAAGTVRVEEAFLRERFGQAYVDYCARTARFIPTSLLPDTPQKIVVDLAALRREARSALAWIWLPIGAEVLAMMRGLPWWPTLF